MKIVTVVGARPQFVKAAIVSEQLLADGACTEVLVHTGQHYDDDMSQVFFTELGIPEPAYHLGVGSGSHAAQTAAMLTRLEPVIVDEAPDAVMVYGDTNSTLAAALTAAKVHVPVVHVEAGLRSFNRYMPEEINRILTDQLADVLFAPTVAAAEHLAREGTDPSRVHVVGDVMLDASLRFAELAKAKSRVLRDNGLERERFVLVTIHRAENTDEDAGCPHLTFFSPESWRHCRLFRRSGFLPYPSKYLFSARGEGREPEIVQLESWQLLPGDRDYH